MPCYLNLDICESCETCNKKNCNYGASLIGLLKHSKLPKKQWHNVALSPEECDRGAFIALADVGKRLFANEEFDKNILICGKHTGNGKTSWSIKLMQQYLKGIAPYYYLQESSKAVFVPVTQFIYDAKDFNGPFRERFTSLAKAADDADLVVWDDIGASELSTYDYTTLLVSIERRILAGKLNIFTTNFTDKRQLSIRVGERLADRVWDTSTVIEIKGGSLRR